VRVTAYEHQNQGLAGDVTAWEELRKAERAQRLPCRSRELGSEVRPSNRSMWLGEHDVATVEVRAERVEEG
jgi:hypothetical protein